MKKSDLFCVRGLCRVSAVLLAGVWFCLAAATAWARLLICSSCGYEIAPGSTTCGHCGAAVPGAEAAAEASDAAHAVVEDGRAVVDAAAVEADLAAALELMRRPEGQRAIDMARLFLRNAAALELLTAPDEAAQRSGRISDLLERTRPLLGRVQTRCPECGGSGKVHRRLSGLSGQHDVGLTTGADCPRCGGSGAVIRASSVSDRLYAMGRARARYAQLQQSRKRVPVGGAWVPAELEGRLTTRQIVILRRATAAPCSECGGIGLVDCEECRGQGQVPCTNRDCRNGKVTVETRGVLGGSLLKRTGKCPVCEGRGALACSECRGRGTRLCEACNGSGQRALCSGCKGQGYQTCSRCGGSGRRGGEPCEKCRGEGILLCGSCKGDGRGR